MRTSFEAKEPQEIEFEIRITAKLSEFMDIQGALRKSLKDGGYTHAASSLISQIGEVVDQATNTFFAHDKKKD